MDITERLEGLINKSGMSKKEIASRMDVHTGSFNSLLKSPSWATLQKFAKALEIDVEEIFSPSIICPHCGKVIKIKVDNDESKVCKEKNR